MLRVGLSGGIGSGKSTVADAFRDLGAVIIDSDVIAREVLAVGSLGLAQVKRRFGDQIIRADGALDRPALGQIVFAEESARRDLEAITHPLIARRTAELFQGAAAEDIVVHDVPLLVEKDMGPAYHLVVIVHSDLEQRLRRLVDDRGMSEADAHARILSQASDEARLDAADVWLENNGSAEDLARRVEDLWSGRLVPYANNVRTHTSARRPEMLTIDPPDPTWPRAATRVMARLRRVFGASARDTISVQHIGSTAVPDLPAKNVIDIQVVVEDLGDLDQHLESLSRAGFFEAPGKWWDEHHGPAEDVDQMAAERSPKRMIRGADPGIITHIHVRPSDSPAVDLALLFRDWLRASPQARSEYADVKRTLAARGLSTSEYAKAKQAWFPPALGVARTWARRSGWAAPRS